MTVQELDKICIMAEFSRKDLSRLMEGVLFIATKYPFDEMSNLYDRLYELKNAIDERWL